MGEKLQKWMRIMDIGSTVIFVLASIAILLLSLIHAPLSALTPALASAILFFVLSLMRRLFKKARPYQENETPGPRKGTDDSFPSRHAYSAFYVASLAFLITPAVSYALLALAVTLSALRGLRGLHYPRDVIAGAFLGVAFANVSIIIL